MMNRIRNLEVEIFKLESCNLEKIEEEKIKIFNEYEDELNKDVDASNYHKTYLSFLEKEYENCKG